MWSAKSAAAAAHLMIPTDLLARCLHSPPNPLASLGRVLLGCVALLVFWRLFHGSEPRLTELVFTHSTLPEAALPGQGHVLVLTPVKNAEDHIEAYFEMLERLEYPKPLMTIAFLVSDSTDRTEAKIRRHAERARSRGRPDYAGIRLFRKDFGFELPAQLRHAYETQPMRRSMLAKARNHLLLSAMDDRASWILWLDIDVVRYDPATLRWLMALDKDVAVANCLKLTDDWEFWGYDRNNWQETEESLALRRRLGPNFPHVEGYHELATRRLYLADMPTHHGKAHVPLDGVGATWLLVKADVHRSGALFPPYVFDGELETEGFARIATRMGYEVVGAPGILVFHADLDQAERNRKV